MVEAKKGEPTPAEELAEPNLYIIKQPRRVFMAILSFLTSSLKICSPTKKRSEDKAWLPLFRISVFPYTPSDVT